MSRYSYDPYATHYASSPYLGTSHVYHEPTHHRSGYHGSEHIGYHDPYYTAPSSRFWDDGYFRNRYASYYDEYPESSYMGHHSGRFPTYTDYLRDRVRNYETDYYPSRSRYSTYNDHYNSPNYRDSYLRGRYYDIDSYPTRYGLRSSDHYGSHDLYGSRYASSRYL